MKWRAWTLCNRVRQTRPERSGTRLPPLWRRPSWLSLVAFWLHPNPDAWPAAVSALSAHSKQETRQKSRKRLCAVTVEFWSFSVSDEVVSNRLWSLWKVRGRSCKCNWVIPGWFWSRPRESFWKASGSWWRHHGWTPALRCRSASLSHHTSSARCLKCLQIHRLTEQNADYWRLIFSRGLNHLYDHNRTSD